MKGTSLMWVLAAFAVYMLGMILVGASFMKKNKNSEGKKLKKPYIATVSFHCLVIL